MSQIYSPSIDLFIYHSCNSENPYLIYEKCDEILEKFGIHDFHIKNRLNFDKESDSLHLDLLKDGENADIFGNILVCETESLKFFGSVYPGKINDSFALGLNIQTSNSIDTSILEKFNPESCLSLDNIKSSLGQTILITASLPPEKVSTTTDDLKKIAKECAKAFTLHSQIKPKIIKDGELFGSSIFEYRLNASHLDYQHIIVWLFNNEQTNIKYRKLYHEFVDLFLEYNKIRQNYWNSRKIYDVLDERYKHIDEKINKFHEITQSDSLDEDTLKKLQQKLKNLAKTASEYTHLLRSFEEQRHLINQNTRNYLHQLNIIKQKSESNDDISFLESYRKDLLDFQEQMNADLAYFVPRCELLTQTILSIRGVVEIEQAIIDRTKNKYDKELARKLTIVGTGVTTASLVTTASVLSAQSAPHIEAIKEISPIREILQGLGLNPIPGKKDLADSVVAISFSILIGLLFGLVTWIMIKNSQFAKKNPK